MEIEIINWDKYNKRSSDYKFPRWFALSNRFFEDSDFFDLTAEEKLFWIYILCQASQKSASVVRLNIEHVKRIGSFSEKAAKCAIDKLVLVGAIILRTDSVRDLASVRPQSDHYITEQNNTEQNRTNNIAQAEAFAEFYSGYPRKIGKADALKAYRRERKAGASAEEILLARDKFKEHHAKAGTEPQFIPYPATFLSAWKDWLDPETGTTQMPKTKSDEEYDRKIAEIFAGGSK